MAKYRPVYTKIWSDPWFEELNANRKLLYLYLFTNDHCNDIGVYPLTLRRMASETNMDIRTIQRALDYFAQSDKIEYNNDQFVWVKNYLKYQPVARNKQSICHDIAIALPSTSHCTTISKHISAILLQNYSATEPYIVEILTTIQNINDQKRSEMIANPNPNPNPNPNVYICANRSDYDELTFIEFWSSYPKKKAKEAALKAWKKLKPNPELIKSILASIEAHKKTHDWQKEKGQFIPYPATFLNGKRWLDEVTLDKAKGQRTSLHEKFEQRQGGSHAEK